MTSAAPPLANVPSASASASTSANAAAAPGASSGGHQSRPVAWGMVGSVFVAYGITIGLQYAFGIIYIVLLDAFGSSRAATAWVGSLSTGILEIAAVLSGLLVSKTSARFCALVGGLLTFAGLFLSSFATELWHMYITFGLLVGLGHALVFPVGIITVNQWFTTRRGLAAGVGTTGVGVGTLIFGPLTKWLVQELGWRVTFRVLSLSAPIAVAAALNFRSPAEVSQHGCCRDGCRWLSQPCGYAAAAVAAEADADAVGADKTGGAASAAHLTSSKPPQQASTFRRMSRVPGLRRLALGLALYGFGFWIPTIHAPRFSQDLGQPDSTVSAMVSAIGLGSMCGRIPLSALADRCGRHSVYTGILALYGTATALLCLITEDSPLAIWVCYAAVVGVCCGSLMALTGPLPVEFVSDPALLPTASTVGFTCLGTGVTFGPPLAGWMFDMRGDYYMSFAFAAVMMWLGAIVLMLPLRLFVRGSPEAGAMEASAKGDQGRPGDPKQP